MITTCKGDEPAAAGDRFRVGASYGVFGSGLSFLRDDVPGADILRRAVMASFEVRLGPESTLGGGLGAGLGGALVVGDRRFAIGPGWLVTATWSRRLVAAVGAKPFVLIGAAAAASGAGTTEQRAPAPASASLYALDLRVAVTAGWTLWQTLSPYVSARAFGGPVFWSYGGQSVIGGDTRHFQLALGLAAALPWGVDVFADCSPVGEQAVTLGLGKAL